MVFIIGLLAAVGFPMVTGYVEDGKKKAAENGLRAIYLVQKDWLRENPEYYGTGAGDHTASINTNLFSGNQTLDESGDYKFQIIADGATKFSAKAIANGKDPLCINQNNKMGCD